MTSPVAKPKSNKSLSKSKKTAASGPSLQDAMFKLFEKFDTKTILRVTLEEHLQASSMFELLGDDNPFFYEIIDSLIHGLERDINSFYVQKQMHESLCHK